MKIYTKRGDKGYTFLIGGEKVPKDDLRVEAYGTIDELSSFFGFACSRGEASEFSEILIKIQKELSKLMVILATPSSKRGKPISAHITQEDIKWIEDRIDEIEVKIPKLKSFILPGGSELASILHICRAITRRAERRVVSLKTKTDDNELDLVITYLNRLGDLLFVMARYANFVQAIEEKTIT